jgi:tellurite resistance protein TehA-like permease
MRIRRSIWSVIESRVPLYKLAVCFQIVIALSIVFVWVGRFPNIVKEFKEYNRPDLVRNAVGATKIALATLLIVGIWYPAPVVGAALFMAFLMFCAQIAHFRTSHPWHKYLPSLALLLVSLFVAGVYSGKIAS